MSDIKLKFPALSGGVEQGLNDAGIETFEGEYAHYVIRECGQNSSDAAASPHEPVEIEIALQFVPAKELPFMGELRTTLEQCHLLWQDDEKACGFFNRAIQLAKRNDIVLLRISDFGTTGVPGGDEDRRKPWYGLVHSRGVSVKNDETSAGAFGIGKDAPLAASQFRTVIYSTRTQEGDVALQGICRLATHDDDGSLTQGTGFIGKYSPSAKKFSAIRNENEIPKMFRREKTGLDVWVVGFQGQLENWEDPFIAAALRNFWPAIHFEKLRMRIGQKQINRQTLPGLMERFRKIDRTVNEAFSYFQAVVGKGGYPREEELALAGNCRLHVLLGSHELPRDICMTRKTGMVIDFYRPRSVRIPFAGLFQCDDRKGNSLLKGLEPPQHNKWDESRAKTQQQKDVLKEIKAWISSSLKSMIPNLDAKVINEDTIADLLPDDLPGENSSDNEETDLGGKPVAPTDTVQPETPKPQVRTPGAGGEGLGQGGLGGGKGETTDPKKGDGKSTGGQKGRTGPNGEQGGGATSSRVRIDLRCYPDESGNGTYNLVARASSDHTGDLRIDAVTEDGSPISCPLSKAFDKDGNPVVVSGNRISGVSIPANGSLRLRVVLERPMRVALRASAL
jgi:hypothetical protein